MEGLAPAGLPARQAMRRARRRAWTRQWVMASAACCACLIACRPGVRARGAAAADTVAGALCATAGRGERGLIACGV